METVAIPAPARGQVLLRMRACSLNFRDLMMADGVYPGVDDARLTPLSDGAGEIVELGEGCGRFAVGDRVCPIFMQSWTGGDMTDADALTALGGTAEGVLQEYIVVDERGLVAMPEAYTFAQAATLPCAAVTAWNALYGREPIQPGSSVLALGSGGVATWAIMIATAAGARVFVTSSSDEKIARMRELGAVAGVNYAKTADWGTAIRDLAGTRGIDKIVDSAGPGTLPQTLEAVRRGGEIALVGVLAPGQMDPLRILTAGALVRGLMVGSRAQFEDLVRAIEHMRIEPVIDRTFAFEDASAAYGYLRSQKHVGKVVIET